jgi:hypothetical protein
MSIMTLNTRLPKIALLLAALAVLAVTALAPAAQAVSAIPVHGKVLNENGKRVGTFTGKVTDLEASVVKTTHGKVLKLSGHLDGTVVRDGTASTSATVSKNFTTTSKAIAACDILNLDIGAIHLNLLGLVVDLAPIHLDVTAVPGAGNLLGNLLCAVAGLLDPSSALANFINGLLSLLFP